MAMSRALILPDGAADETVLALGGRTPLQAARTPHMDWIAQNGVVGTVVTVPEGFTPASDVATLSVLGYDPAVYYTGRAPIEAVAQGLSVGLEDTVFRCNLTTIEDGVMVDFSAGHIGQDDAETLIQDLNENLADDTVRWYPGVMYRHLLIMKSANPEVRCTPPHDIMDQPVANHRPDGADAPRLQALMDQARAILEDHPVNRRRRDRGLPPGNAVWLWGQGRMPVLPPFESRFGLRGGCIAAVDLIRGLAGLVGWRIVDVPGATGYLDTDYAAKGRAATALLEECDLVCVHIEAPDEAGHNGDADAKVLALERVDEHIVGPLLESLRSRNDWRVLVAPDHPTPVARRTHTSVPPPFCMSGTGIPPGGSCFDEVSARTSRRHVAPGHRLMEYFVDPTALANV